MSSAVRKYFWIFNVAAWTVLALFMSRQLYDAYRLSDHPINWFTAFIMEMAYCLQWILLAPWVLRLAMRFRFDSRSWYISAPVHIVSGMMLSSLTMIVRTILQWIIIRQMAAPFSWERVLHSAFEAYDYGIMSYLLLLLISYVFEYYGRFQEREHAAARLETQLVQAQLQALRMQLHPHFLFNTLHAIAVLIRKNDHQTAVAMLTGLSDLLRRTLNGAPSQEVSLKQELEILDIYIKIQKMRFQDRLSVSMDISPDVLEAQVPHLVLQPLVENAIQHGIAALAKAGHLSVQARRENGWLCVRVQDDGPGFTPPIEELPSKGIGLSNTRARLQKMYGASCRLDLTNHPEGGAVVSLKIPYQTIPQT